MRTLLGTTVMVALGAASLSGQAPTVTNSIGMEFALIQPGAINVGRIAPVCRRPGPGVGGGGGRGGGGGGGAQGAQVGGGAGAAAGAGAAPGGGAAPGAAPAAPRPAPDPRTQWTADDFARCDQMAFEAYSPGFTATVRQPFYLGKHEVTQAQWKRVMGANPSTFQGDKVTDDADRHPVETVTWQDAQRFIARLNQMEPNARYRLPTEFEWELAARGGITADVILIADQRRQSQTSRVSTLMVGQKEPNAFGLYDMLGNVWEWVQDFDNGKVFADPTPPRTGTQHVLKGAGFLGDPKNLTWTYHGGGPGNGFDVGFRVVREVQ